MSAPPESTNFTRKGAPRGDKSHGDEYVTLKVVLPEKLDPELEEFAQRWEAA